MRRILIFSTNYLPAIGGAEVAIKEIADRLPGVEFDLLTARLSRSRPKEEKIGGITVHRLGFGFSFDKYLLPFWGALRARRLHRKNRFDLIWAMMASYGGIAAAFFKKSKPKIPMVLTLQEGDEEKHLSRYVFGNNFLYRTLIRPWYRLPLLRADFITTISEYLADRARVVAPETRIEVVPNGVDFEKFSADFDSAKIAALRSEFGFKPDDVVTVSVSRLVLKNGLFDLVKAAMLLPDNHKILIIGEGELRSELEREIFDLGLTGKVVLAGAVPNGEIPLFLKAADVFARPSLSEGFGNVFVESFAASLPVVATPIGGILDFLEDKKTGVFCGVGDPTDLALKIVMVVNDKDLRKSIVANAKTLAKEKYDWNKITGSMEAVFKKLASEERISIVIATGIYPPQIGGSAEYALNLNRVLTACGHRSRVVTYGAERVLPTGIRHAVFFFRCLFALARADAILALDNFSAAVPAVFAARTLGKKSCVRLGGDFLWEQYVERTGQLISLPAFNKKMPGLSFKEKVIYKLIRWVFFKTDILVSSTKWLAEIFTESYRLPNHKIKVIENFYAPKSEKKEPVKKNFVWAGRNIRLKNLANVKKAFTEAKKENSEIEFEAVSYSHALLLEKIKSAYATVSVSLSEVSPNFVIESVYCGTPFITTKHCGIRDRLGDIGLYADPENINDIKAKILELADARHYAEFVKKQRAFNFTHSWEEISGEFLRIIKPS